MGHFDDRRSAGNPGHSGRGRHASNGPPANAGHPGVTGTNDIYR
jgi:hypothetical protein